MAISISPQEAATLVSAQQALLIDLRELEEYQSLRVKEALLFPLSVLPQMAAPLALAVKDRPVIFFCHAGHRTRANESLLDTLAPGQAHIMEGGIRAWKKAGLPIIEEKHPWPIMRQVQVAAGGLILLTLLLSLITIGFLWLTAFIGAGLVFAGVTGFCGLARVLMRMPWNQKKP